MTLVLPVEPESPRFSVAPMMDWTDRHCRQFHRRLSRHARLYTEMIVSAAIVHGERERLLAFDDIEHPVALQLGGNDPRELALAAGIGARLGYDEINLNCGCPSDRVREGAFGACLMREPQRVAQCVARMVDTVAVPVTVKHRIGIGRDESYAFVRDFVGEVSRAGATAVIVHARNAWLEGLSPKENRQIPPLRYEVVHRLKRDFPQLPIWLNGGLTDHRVIEREIAALDGAMVGRAAYETPWLLADVDARYPPADRLMRAPPSNPNRSEPASVATRPERGSNPHRHPATSDDGQVERRVAIAHEMADYAARRVALGDPLRRISRHMLGLFNGLPGARRWRRTLSDSVRLAGEDADLIRRAADQMLESARFSGPREATIRFSARQ